MLAVHKPPLTNGGGPSDILSLRGRSRQVSRSALARQASEERKASCASAAPFFATERTYTSSQTSPISTSKDQPMITVATPTSFPPSFTRTTSPSPLSSASMTPDTRESPPPPISLEDQVHEAYALEDIHLAKILLLRLKGIEVTSDDDPRIAAVQDEDFDFCFLPNGPLLNEQDEMALKELQSRELERMEELRRVEWMRMCERKWIEEKQRLRAQRAAEFRRRERKRQEEEQRQHRTKEEERRRSAEEQRKVSKVPSTLRTTARAERKFVNYDHLACEHIPASREQQFVYDYMVTRPSLLAARQPPTSTPVCQRPLFPTPTFDESRTVAFKDVLKSMEGLLFPDDKRTHRNASPANSVSRTSRGRGDLQLLDALLAEVEYTEEVRRKRKGKGQERGHSQRFPICLACSVCQSPLPSPSSTLSSSSVVSRTSSWLTFRTSSSPSSSCTDLTTLSSSPITSRKSPWLASRPQSWITVPTVTDTPPPTPESLLRHSCRAYNRLTTIPLSEAPLVIEVSTPSPKSSPLSYEGCQRSSSRVRNTKESGLLVKRVSRIVELAKNIQSAYVAAALFSVVVSYEDADENHAFSSARRKYSNSANRQVFAAPGSRASVNDVKIFLTGSVRGEDDTECSPAAKYIQLTTPYPPTEPPRTILPDPLPYRLHFKPLAQLVRPPFLNHAHAKMDTMYPAAPLSEVPFGQLSWRIRCVANPAYLRLKAVQNIGVKWEGCGRDTAMGGGSDRVSGIAYTGVGRSNLSYSNSTSD